jgi:Leucine-rich repeat (LRR) protein
VLPDSIGNLSKLYHLFLDINLLTSLPDTIINLPNIRFLHLSDNPLPTNITKLRAQPLLALLRVRVFYKRYFGLALGCSFPVVEAIIIAATHAFFGKIESAYTNKHGTALYNSNTYT